MDIAKYIGLFLLKNEQCYINGLGTLQLLRRASKYDGQNLHAAHYEVTLVPGGNVDESLSNFIATNEMTSISKASDRLKEFSAETKATLQENKEVVIPFIGSFALQDGRIIFITDPLLLYKPGNIAAQRGASIQHEEPASGTKGFVLPTAPPNPAVAMPGTAAAMSQAAPQQAPPPPQEEEGGKLNWWRIIFVLLFLAILAGGAYYGYQRFLAPKKRTTKPLTIPEMNERRANDDNNDNNKDEEQVATIDSAKAAERTEEAKDTDTKEEQPAPKQVEKPKEKQPEPVVTKKEEEPKPTPPPTVEPKDMISFKAVINTYDSKEDAYARARQLRKYGRAEVIEEDTNYYFVAIPVRVPKDRKQRALDSLTNRYNQDGVFVY